MKQERISQVRLRFRASGASPWWVANYVEETGKALAALFDISPAAVLITAEERLPEDAPFCLTCYAGKSASVPAMARAARVVLPALLHLQKFTRPEDWVPGEDAARDAEALEGVGAGLAADEEQALWVADTAELFGLSGDLPLPAQAQYILSQFGALAIQTNADRHLSPRQSSLSL